MAKNIVNRNNMRTRKKKSIANKIIKLITLHDAILKIDRQLYFMTGIRHKNHPQHSRYCKKEAKLIDLEHKYEDLLKKLNKDGISFKM
jgi:hypothetical protein